AGKRSFQFEVDLRNRPLPRGFPLWMVVLFRVLLRPLSKQTVSTFFLRRLYMQFKLKLIAGAAGLSLAGVAAAQDAVVKIGHVGPTSGAIAHLGKDNENGARMAIDELNAKGVTIGGKEAKVELLAEGGAGAGKQGTAAAQKRVDSKVNGVIGHLNSGPSIPASKVYSDAGIPQISPSATNPKYTRQGFKTAFRGA